MNLIELVFSCLYRKFWFNTVRSNFTLKKITNFFPIEEILTKKNSGGHLSTFKNATGGWVIFYPNYESRR